MTTLHSKKKVKKWEEHEYIYIGRKDKGAHFGNPFSHKDGTLAAVKVETVEEAVQKYDEWLDGKHPEIEPQRRLWVLEMIPFLRNKKLLCYCDVGSPCHGRILIRRAEQT